MEVRGSIKNWDGKLVRDIRSSHVILHSISLKGKGFRGGPSFPVAEANREFPAGGFSFRDNTTSISNTSYNGAKGEGFIGYPRFPIGNGLLSETTYPEGFDCGAGSPGSAGGGGIYADVGGGGGSNGGNGGDGKHKSPGQTVPAGIGANPAPFNPYNRIFLGGGGGGVAQNNPELVAIGADRGGAGGGLLFIHAFFSLRPPNASVVEVDLSGESKPNMSNFIDGGPGGMYGRPTFSC